MVISTSKLSELCADGIITWDEWEAAEELMQQGVISLEEFDLIDQAHDNGCPGSGSIDIPGVDPCTDVYCNETCIDYNLWNEECVNGECVKTTIQEANSPRCGYIEQIAKGKLGKITFNACHSVRGCSTTKAYWGSKVTVYVDCENVGNVPGSFKVRILGYGIDISSAYETIGVNTTYREMISFTMPSVANVNLKVELIRND